MSTSCPKCAAVVADDDRFCPKCYATIEPPSFWQRILAPFRTQAKVIKSALNIKITTNVVTHQSGERHEYHSLDEVPPEIRAKIRDALAQGHVTTSKTFKIRDASGQERVYCSLDEMPPEIRAIVERAAGKADGK